VPTIQILSPLSLQTSIIITLKDRRNDHKLLKNTECEKKSQTFYEVTYFFLDFDFEDFFALFFAIPLRLLHAIKDMH
jgi:hypothetical protein